LALLMWHSKSNPVYWFKNVIVFFCALPILDDVYNRGVTHIHADFGSSPATIAWLGKKMFGTGMSIRYHSFDIHHQGIGWRDPLRRQKLRDADVVFAAHTDGLSHLKRMVPDVNPDRFRMIRICVVFKAEARKREPSTPPLVIAAGNLVAAKGFGLLIEAAAVLKRRGRDIRVRILGEGPQRKNLTAIVERNRLGDRVEMPGYYQHFELARHLAEAVALVVPPQITKSGLREGLPTVIVEAWLSKTAVIASPVGGIPEVVEDGKTGLIFPAGDAEALADCIERLSEEPALGTAIAEQGYATALELFSPEKNVRALLDEIDVRCGRPAP
jgi:glycosyltransferase involved in cell wall biosynthesis